jgi:hypothetical protein
MFVSISEGLAFDGLFAAILLSACGDAMVLVSSVGSSSFSSCPVLGFESTYGRWWKEMLKYVKYLVLLSVDVSKSVGLCAKPLAVVLAQTLIFAAKGSTFTLEPLASVPIIQVSKAPLRTLLTTRISITQHIIDARQAYSTFNITVKTNICSLAVRAGLH